jgi:hypothetical protein
MVRSLSFVPRLIFDLVEDRKRRTRPEAAGLFILARKRKGREVESPRGPSSQTRSDAVSLCLFSHGPEQSVNLRYQNQTVRTIGVGLVSVQESIDAKKFTASSDSTITSVPGFHHSAMCCSTRLHSVSRVFSQSVHRGI